MNRKQALFTILAGVVPWASFARAGEREDERQEPPMKSRSPGPTVQELQAQIAELTRRLQQLEQTQANTVGFTKSGNDLELAHPSGNVVIRAGGGVNLKAGSSMQLIASGTLEHKGALITLN
jgi:hypothetical protein